MPHRGDGAGDERADEHELRELLELTALALLGGHHGDLVPGSLVQGLLQIGQQLGCDLAVGCVDGRRDLVEGVADVRLPDL